MLEKYLLYLLIFLIPVQLGRHFYFDFAAIAGIYSDYLLPTLYLTDIIIVFLIVLDIKNTKPKLTRSTILFFSYLVFTTIFIAVNKWAALYKLIKIFEFYYLFKIIVKSKIQLKGIVTAYSLAIIYSSLLSILQFIQQKSIGGLWWFIGERTFYASTPGIAQAVFMDNLILRPYASFAHPNLFGGFLAIGLPLVFILLIKQSKVTKQKWIYIIAFILGTIALVLTFSRAAWLIFFIGLVVTGFLYFKKIKSGVSKNYNWLFLIFIFLFVISILFPLLTTTRKGSLYERKTLIEASVKNIINNSIFGTGLNNSLIQQYSIMPKNLGLFIAQPVHNIYLLTLVELGLCGFLFLLKLMKNLFNGIRGENLKQNVPFLMMLVLGFFDHYLFTLQQGILIFVLFASLGTKKTNL